jgi:hypothetical protein
MISDPFCFNRLAFKIREEAVIETCDVSDTAGAFPFCKEVSKSGSSIQENVMNSKEATDNNI